MKFFLPIFPSAAVAGLALLVGVLSGCSEDKTAGIEIGNPNLADSSHVDVPKEPVVVTGIPLTADFTVDYADLEPASSTKSLLKAASEDEPVLLDSFDLNLTEVRTYASYYKYMDDYDATKGMRVWPERVESSSDEEPLEDSSALLISFTKETYVDDAFKNIDLMDGGYLKEIGVSFAPYVADDIYGRVMIDGEYVPFVYDLTDFQSLQLRYHYSQIAIDSVNKVANLSVVFRAKLFTEGVDFSKANISEDGVIYIDRKNNSDIWDELNERFVPSFQPLRYNYVNAANEDSTAYVADIWKGIAADVGENTLINGNFKSPFTTDWILVTQFGGKADSSVIVEKNGDRIMKVDVTAGGDSSFSVQLLQENVALIAGVKYQCVFTIWSDVADSITARIGSYDTYKTVGFSKHVYVGKTGQSIQIEFTPEVTDPFARFELNLGKKKRWFKIKDVQVLRQN